MLSLVAAVAANRVIGRSGAVPWRLPADLAHFRKLTLGHPVLMGRRTFQSIGWPLAGRRNIVLSRSQDLQAPGCIVVHSLEEAREAAGEEELFVIGGAEVYALCLPRAARLYITHIDVEVPGDTYFPVIDSSAWTEVNARCGRVDAENTLSHRFVTYERRGINSPASP